MFIPLHHVWVKKHSLSSKLWARYSETPREPKEVASLLFICIIACLRYFGEFNLNWMHHHQYFCFFRKCWLLNYYNFSNFNYLAIYTASYLASKLHTIHAWSLHGSAMSYFGHGNFVFLLRSNSYFGWNTWTW